MKDLACIVAAAGRGERLGLGYNKAFALLQGRPLLSHTLQALAATGLVAEAVVALGPQDLAQGQELLERYQGDCFPSLPVRLVAGGATRTASVAAALAAVGEEAAYIAVHDGARPLVSPQVFARTLAAARRYGGAVAAVPVKDTIKVVDGEGLVVATPPRSSLVAVQTPQIFRRELLQQAYAAAAAAGRTATDDAALVEALGARVAQALGAYENIKVTTPEDLRWAASLLGRQEEKMYRIGSGFDVHRLVPGRRLVLCGVELPSELGLLGHSDADVALHALMDALLGGAALGDIGRHFPDTDQRYLGADSRELARQVAELVRRQGYQVENVDITIIAQRPKLAPYIEELRRSTAAVLGLEAGRVSVKATTTEGLGYTGRGEGIAAQAVALLSSS